MEQHIMQSGIDGERWRWFCPQCSREIYFNPSSKAKVIYVRGNDTVKHVSATSGIVIDTGDQEG